MPYIVGMRVKKYILKDRFGRRTVFKTRTEAHDILEQEYADGHFRLQNPVEYVDLYGRWVAGVYTR